VLAVAAGLPVAFLLARVRLPGIAVARTLVLVPFVLPTVVVGLAFRALWPDGRSGVDHPGQRLFQCNRGGEDGGRALDTPRRAGRRRGAGAGRVTVARLPIGDLAVAGTGHRVRLVVRLDDASTVDAVAAVTADVTNGDQVHLELDADGVAVIG
jgi:hypothetical protein